ncbi:MAG: [Fe-Fe] hydrogenase large subunit C-terminal domain-containing protein [candidate division KSB1 bacterium]|nr:[Fe-Fe] hydrogenase large subunit C-terminal domain-containing protein [candidate division KSB1 bacterium]
MEPIVLTIETKCKRCYSCVRQCPARAIKVEDGQARVLINRCIACGNCVKVCPQQAKQIRDGTTHTRDLLEQSDPVFALLAPSFPAAFSAEPEQVITGLRALGFSQVLEVAFGADLVVEEYKKLIHSDVMPAIIASPCPAMVNFIEKYYAHLNMVLAPIVSPMIAMGRAVKYRYFPGAKTVFIGPCIAKKKEMLDNNVKGVIDQVLTYRELNTLFLEHKINPETLEKSDFDGPRADLGRIFPVSGGLLKCAGETCDVLDNDIVVSEGRERVIDVLDKAGEGQIEAHFLDLLFCRGCINGPVMPNEDSVYVHHDRITKYVKRRSSAALRSRARRDRQLYADINLRRAFNFEEITMREPSEAEIRNVLLKTGKRHPEDELNCGACGYASCRAKAKAVCQGLAEAEMCLPYMVEQLESIQEELSDSNDELKKSLNSLKQAQEQLVQAEKMASVGRLAAGVAHELNNPLGGILLYSNILLKKLEHEEEEKSVQWVVKEAERCRKIVRGLLDFSRQRQLDKSRADLNEIIEKTLVLIKEPSLFKNIKLVKQYGKPIAVYVDKLQIQQVLLNIILNAAEAMNGEGTLILGTDNTNNAFASVSIADTGPGMSRETREKIFDPFFTTKPVGKGTGLGLAMAYGTIQKHGGEIKVNSRLGKGTRFTITLPLAMQTQKTSAGIKRISATP